MEANRRRTNDLRAQRAALALDRMQEIACISRTDSARARVEGAVDMLRVVGYVVTKQPNGKYEVVVE